MGGATSEVCCCASWVEEVREGVGLGGPGEDEEDEEEEEAEGGGAEL